jgi:hypothetical protein
MRFLRSATLIALMAVSFSCSDDDKEPQPNIEDAALSLAESSEVLEVPEALLTSDDPNAQLAASWIEMANGLSANLAMFTPPANAARSTDLITPVNGRVASNSGVVYTWSDPSYGSVAYQITDASDKYTFELFYKGLDDTGYYRYLYAEEMKDRSEGYIALYDAWGTETDTRDAELMRWEWSRAKENFTFKMTVGENDLSFTVTVNTKTKAGSVVYNESSVKMYEMNWNADGSGAWKYFDETGAVTEEGTWTV